MADPVTLVLSCFMVYVLIEYFLDRPPTAVPLERFANRQGRNWEGWD